MQKDKVRRLVDSLPDEVNVDALIEKLHLLDKLEAAERQIETGKVMDHAEVKGRVSRWLN
ncbi:MAG: hypothetical protein HY000_19470 [Planctomycetes bacterium]|nr:hypothetical protein [Planctomycetota bacterium]